MSNLAKLGYHYSFVLFLGLAMTLSAICMGLQDWIVRGPVIEGNEAVIYKDGLWKSCRYTRISTVCHSSFNWNQTASNEVVAWCGPVSSLIVTGFVAFSLGFLDMVRRLRNAEIASDINMGLPCVLVTAGTFCTFISLEIQTSQADKLCQENWEHQCEFGEAYKVAWASFIFGMWSFAPLLIYAAGKRKRNETKEEREDHLQPISNSALVAGNIGLLKRADPNPEANGMC